MGLRYQGVGVGVGVGEVSLGVVCRTLCCSRHLLLFLELLLLQAALLLTKLGPAILEPDLAEEWIDGSVLGLSTEIQVTASECSVFTFCCPLSLLKTRDRL